MDLQKRSFFRGKFLSPVSDVHLPWLKSVSTFYDDCTRCDNCLSSCPEDIIVRGDGGYPTVDFKYGECTFCRDCASDCPSGLFDFLEKSPWSLLAEIDQSCLSFQGIACRSCQDSCSYGAINFPLKLNQAARPEVNNALCTGCGACVSPCPVNAIKILENKDNF